MCDNSNSLRAIYADKQVGECFEFGRYPQGENGEVKPITWRVLHCNYDSLLVISEKALDCKRYNDEYESTAWSHCTLRKWLNNEFLSKAFNEQEQTLIEMSELTNNAGLDTDDRIFLLSEDEAENYFAVDHDRVCKPTDYAVKRGVCANSGECWDDGYGDVYKGNTCFWLRSRSFNYYSAACVFPDGGIYHMNVDNDDFSVRPALRLAI